jgi:hypothetical protein
MGTPPMGIMPGSDPGAASGGGMMSPDDSGRTASIASGQFNRMPGPRVRAPRAKTPRSSGGKRNFGASMRGSMKRIGKPRVRTGMSLRPRSGRV